MIDVDVKKQLTITISGNEAEALHCLLSQMKDSGFADFLENEDVESMLQIIHACEEALCG